MTTLMNFARWQLSVNVAPFIRYYSALLGITQYGGLKTGGILPVER